MGSLQSGFVFPSGGGTCPFLGNVIIEEGDAKRQKIYLCELNGDQEGPS